VQQVGLVGRDAHEGVRGAGRGDGALVAVEAAVMADLEDEGAVAVILAALDADAAGDALGLVNEVLVVGVLDEAAPDGAGGQRWFSAPSSSPTRLSSKKPKQSSQ
jgi:hypothetical protein